MKTIKRMAPSLHLKMTYLEYIK